MEAARQDTATDYKVADISLADAGRKQIQDDLRLWYRDSAGGANASVSEWRSALQSPRLFARYVSDRLAASVLW